MKKIKCHVYDIHEHRRRRDRPGLHDDPTDEPSALQCVLSHHLGRLAGDMKDLLKISGGGHDHEK